MVEGRFDGGPGVIRPQPPKEHGSRTPGILERVGDKVRETFTRLKAWDNAKNYEHHTKRGIPYPLDIDGKPKVATRLGFDKFKAPVPNSGTEDGENNPPSEDVLNEIAAGGPTHPVVGGQDKD